MVGRLGMVATEEVGPGAAVAEELESEGTVEAVKVEGSGTGEAEEVALKVEAAPLTLASPVVSSGS